MRIIADQREKNSLVISELMHLGEEVELKHLKVADYIIGKVAIERKTASDFVSSIINKRLVKQLEEIKQFEKQLLIIEGDLSKTNFNENAIKGMLLSILLEFKIPILLTEDSLDTASFLSRIAKRADKPQKDIGLKIKKKTFSLDEQQQLIIEGIPWVGPKLAKELLKRFGTVQGVFNATEEELEKVNKLGKKKAKIIKNLVTEVYNPRK